MICENGLLGRILVVPDSGYYEPWEVPLNKRGWTLQERLLSPRVLTLGLQQMYWQYQSELQCEGGSACKSITPERLGHQFFKCKGDISTETDPDQVHEKWPLL